jgi:arylsulfatase A-like enzyme
VKLMTGQSNLRNYVRFSILAPDQRTFGHLMREAGYVTGVVGKWQLYGAEHYEEGVRGLGMLPAGAGFDEHFLWQVERFGSRYWAPLTEVDGEATQWDEETYGPDLFADWAIDFIDRHQDERFFLYYPMVLPHSPFEAPPGHDGPRESTERAADRQANFAAMIRHLDIEVGRVVAALDERDLRRKTLVLFTSDNGAARGIVTMRDGVPVQGGKGGTTDAATHVPLIASLPGAVPAGAVCDDLIDFSDFLPTLAEVAGVELPAGVPCDGRSFLAQALGREGDPREALFCYSNPRPDERPGWEARFARDHRYKLYSDGRLFDVQSDPLEETPLEPPEADDARARLEAVLASMPEPPRRLRAGS